MKTNLQVAEGSAFDDTLVGSDLGNRALLVRVLGIRDRAALSSLWRRFGDRRAVSRGRDSSGRVLGLDIRRERFPQDSSNRSPCLHSGGEHTLYGNGLFLLSTDW